MTTTTVWRIVNRQAAATAYSGDCARRYGGRFNRVGIPIVYASGSLSLAVVELIAQAGRRDRLLDRVCVPAVLLARHIAEAADLPQDWNRVPSEASSRKYGDDWSAASSSLVLRVPSVVISHEWNYLINPQHPDYDQIKVAKPIPIPLDPRQLPQRKRA